MKKILIPFFVLLSMSSFAQQSYYVTAGGTYNYVKSKYSESLDVTAPIGYYAGVSVNYKFADKIGATGSLLYINQSAKFDAVNETVSINSIGGLFSFNYYPMGEGLKIMGGLNIGMVLNQDDLKDLFGYHAGVGYEIWKFDITLRYNRIISNSPFLTTTMVGVGYKFAGE